MIRSGTQDCNCSRVTLIHKLIDLLILTLIDLMANKKRKLSGLSGSELLIAYNSLLKLKDTLTYTELEEEELSNTDETPLEGFDEQVDSMTKMLKSRLEGPNV